jgi:hypothetical protein
MLGILGGTEAAGAAEAFETLGALEIVGVPGAVTAAGATETPEVTGVFELTLSAAVDF